MQGVCPCTLEEKEPSAADEDEDSFFHLRFGGAVGEDLHFETVCTASIEAIDIARMKKWLHCHAYKLGGINRV